MNIMKTIITILLAFMVTAAVHAQNVKNDSLPKKPAPGYSNSNFESAFVPGVGYTYYQTTAPDSTGVFNGISVEYLIYAKVFQNDKPGPSHVRFYSKLIMLKSDKSDVTDMFSYSLGISMSVEKNPKRTVMVPYFGLEFGGLSQKSWGTTAQFTPTLGCHLVSRRNLFINVQGGYVYPVSNFDILQGWNVSAGVNFALW